MKGQIPILEMISVVVILFVTFGIFFPEIVFSNRWEDANIILKGRDIMLTIDRLDSINNFVADENELKQFLEDVLPERELITWTTLDGTVQSSITVACNCTTDQVDQLLDEVSRFKLNNRNLSIDFISSTLSSIQKSDVLLIWDSPDNRDLTGFKDEIITYLESGNGVISLSDDPVLNDAYIEIFGVDTCLNVGVSCSSPNAELEFPTTVTVEQEIFQTHKLFYHLPIRSSANSVAESTIPIDPASGIPVCEDNAMNSFPPTGTFGFKDGVTSQDLIFWICRDQLSVYFDTTGGRQANVVVESGEEFSVSGFIFKINYVELFGLFGNVFISIKPDYKFNNFRPSGLNLYPTDQKTSRILLKDDGRNEPAIVINKSVSGIVIWAPEFPEFEFRDDKKILLASMIFAASNKQSRDPFVGNFQVGFSTPYVNIVSQDMFEVYQFNLGLGFPF